MAPSPAHLLHSVRPLAFFHRQGVHVGLNLLVVASAPIQRPSAKNAGVKYGETVTAGVSGAAAGGLTDPALSDMTLNSGDDRKDSDPACLLQDSRNKGERSGGWKLVFVALHVSQMTGKMSFKSLLGW